MLIGNQKKKTALEVLRLISGSLRKSKSNCAESHVV